MWPTTTVKQDAINGSVATTGQLPAAAAAAADGLDSQQP